MKNTTENGEQKLFSWHKKLPISPLLNDNVYDTEYINEHEKYNKYYGQDGRGLSHGDDNKMEIVSEISLDFLNGSQIQQLSCGDNHTVLLDTSGNIYTCGINKEGQLNQDFFIKAKPTSINDYSNISIYIQNNDKFNIKRFGNMDMSFNDLYDLKTFEDISDNGTNALNFDISHNTNNINNDSIIIKSQENESKKPKAIYNGKDYGFNIIKFNTLKSGFYDKLKQQDLNIFDVVFSNTSGINDITFYFNKPIDSTVNSDNYVVGGINDWRNFLTFITSVQLMDNW